jgi:outer membrane protein assembly factor BamB
MKYIYMMLIVFAFAEISVAQEGNSNKFAFDSKDEEDPQFVLKDNYNYYLMTIMDAYDIAAGHAMILRKFDHKNVVVETFKYEFPKIDQNTHYNYLGFAESENGKVAVFVRLYSGKALKSEIYKLEFDKTTAKFTSTLLVSSPIVSAMKSGGVSLEKSDNGKNIAINYHGYRTKGMPDQNHMIVLEAKTLNVIWQKELSFTDEFTSQNFVITNFGKVVLVRDMKGSKKGITYLSIISAEGKEDKAFEAHIFLNEMKAISIGQEDYLIALNSDSKNFRSDFYNKLLMYDLKSGRILNNTKISGFSSLSGLEDVIIRNISIQDNSIYVFTEAKVEAAEKPTNGATAVLETKYHYGPSYMYVLAMDGQYKSTRKLLVDAKPEANLYHSFGVMNIKGSFYMNAGNSNGLYRMNFNDVNSHKSIMALGNLYHDGTRFVPQLMTYFPDKKALVCARTVGTDQMAIVQLSVE